MSEVQVVTALLVTVSILSALAAAVNLSHPVVLVVAGLALGFVPGVPDLRLEPDVVFLLFLPPLLYAAAFRLAAEDLRANLRPIGFLAIGLVLGTVGLVAVVGHYVIGLAWAPAFVLGAVLGPTDPIAATAIVRRLGGPSRAVTILEGESLVNDAVALATLSVAIGAVGASFHPLSAASEFVATAAGGAAIGVGIGLGATFVLRRARQGVVEITVALATTYAAFLAAEIAGVSAILASVAAGLTVSTRAGGEGEAETRIETISFWNVATFLVESALFVLSGLVFQEVLDGLARESVADLAGEAALVIVTVAGLRLAWMLVVPRVFHLLDPRAEGGAPPTSRPERVLLGAASMRGAVTIAAALSIPASAAGHAFPQRDLILFLAYATVVVTLTAPTLAMPSLMRRLGLVRERDRLRAELDARRSVAEAAIERADQLAAAGSYPEHAISRARDTYEMRVARLHDRAGTQPATDPEAAESYRALREELVDAERQALHELSDDHSLPGELLREIQRDIDLAEARLRE